MQLSRQDIEFLMDCVDAKEKVDSQTEFVGEMLTAVFCKGEDQYEKAKREAERRREESQAKQRVVRDRCTLLRAKLIHVRDSLDADNLLESSRKTA
jgi:hypothetical protein